MKNKKAILFGLLIVLLLLPYSQVAVGQEFSGGAKLVDTSPFVFTEARFGIIAVELGAGLVSPDDVPAGYEESNIEISLAGKIYPLKMRNLSPYLGASTHYSTNGTFTQSRTFGGVQFDFPGGGAPISAFAGADIVFTETGGEGYGWHFGVKYKFSFG